ncbi:MAG TPA: energy transducer TonB [Terriglobia bacterium]|nr:energy transducer TonB [Terriglobia bacterium]
MGALLKHKEAGPWTLYGSIRVDQVHVSQDKLKIEGTRMFLIYEKKEKEFAELPGGDVYIVIDLDPSRVNLNSITKSLKQIFVTPGENLADVEPAYWRHFLLSSVPGKAAVEELTVLDGQPVYKIEPGKVTAPKEIFHPAPDYTQEARDAHYNGSLTLSLVVNAQGRSEDISILEPSGMGLDDNAVAKVQTWKFKPGLRNGVPVPVRVKLDVSFSIGRF